MSGLRNWVVWSLYDGSGYAVKDWADAGYKCYCFNYDGANHGDYDGVKIIHPNIEYVNVWIDSHFLVMFSPELSVYPDPDIILGFPPCDDLAVSGARWFVDKYRKDPCFQNKAARNAMLLNLWLTCITCRGWLKILLACCQRYGVNRISSSIRALTVATYRKMISIPLSRNTLPTATPTRRKLVFGAGMDLSSRYSVLCRCQMNGKTVSSTRS